MPAVDPISAGIEAGGSLIGGIAGMASAANDRAAARRAIERALANYANIPLPDLQRMLAEQLGPSAMEGVSANPELEGDQYGALGELGRIADAGGLTLEDKTNLDAARREAATQAMRQRKSILNLIRRSGSGMLGGASVAAQLGAAGQQQEADALAGAQTNAAAQRRATEAVLNRGRLAASQRGQQFGEDAAKAAARDAINKYNTVARQTAQNYNLGLPQQQFSNRMALASGESNALNGVANQYTSDADRTQRTFANMGTGLGQAAGAFVPKPRAAAPATAYDYPDVAAPVRLNEEDQP